MRGWLRLRVAALVACALVLAACGGSDSAPTGQVTAGPDADVVVADLEPTEPAPTPDPAPAGSAPEPEPELVDDPFARPDWLGTRVLPDGPGGFGAILPTPAELDPRRLRTPSLLPDPATEAFVSSVSAVPDEVLARSTWEPGCPVTVDELRYVNVSFWGFDGEHHTGELLVNASFAERIVEVFARLHAARFPIEEMRVTAAEELDFPATGDGNNTSAFVCRVVRGGSSFSQHAYGLAIDVNPFHNPYTRGEIVLPELASTYVDRSNVRDGMFTASSVPVVAFGDIGWAWGGAWTGQTRDTMHFSANGR